MKSGFKAAIAFTALFLILGCCQASSIYEGVSKKFNSAFDELEEIGTSNSPTSLSYYYDLKKGGLITITFCRNKLIADSLTKELENYNKLLDSTFSEREYGIFRNEILRNTKVKTYRNNNVILWALLNNYQYNFNTFSNKLSNILKNTEFPENNQLEFDPSKSNMRAFFLNSFAVAKDNANDYVESEILSFEHKLYRYGENISKTSYEDLKSLQGLKAGICQDRLDAIGSLAKLLEEEKNNPR